MITPTDKFDFNLLNEEFSKLDRHFKSYTLPGTVYWGTQNPLDITWTIRKNFGINPSTSDDLIAIASVDIPSNTLKFSNEILSNTTPKKRIAYSTPQIYVTGLDSIYANYFTVYKTGSGNSWQSTVTGVQYGSSRFSSGRTSTSLSFYLYSNFIDRVTDLENSKIFFVVKGRLFD